MANDLGILLTNIGSPTEPTPRAVRQYLKKFLSDKRVVELPRLIWWPILYGIILPFRSKSSAKLYKKIWMTDHGSPLTYYSQQLANKLQTQLGTPVELGMHYGLPTIKSALEKLRDQHVKKILILPLYPQYSATTTATTFDQVANELTNWRVLPEIQTINDYHANDTYINTLVETIQQHPIKHLLFSFHGIPQNFIDKGDSYADQCNNTVRLITEKLNLSKDQWSISFQSRLGRAKWLTPYTDEVLKELPKRGITDIHVICPGFAVDCLETLEEIAIRGKEQFLEAGGKIFHYIPALNYSDKQVVLLNKIICAATNDAY